MLSSKVALTVLFAAILYGVYIVLEQNLESLYIFNPTSLHQISVAAIEQHGNNTQAIVTSIIASLRQSEAINPYLSVQEEWVFNNAGGAMGAMYIIHASKSSSHQPL